MKGISGLRVPDYREDCRLEERVKASYEKSRRTYGARRIREDWVEAGETISRTRVGRLMRQQDLEVKTRRRFRATTDSRHFRPVAENRLARPFRVKHPDRVYAGDITFIPTAEGWLYLTVLMDLYSRRAMGWALSERITGTGRPGPRHGPQKATPSYVREAQEAGK